MEIRRVLYNHKMYFSKGVLRLRCLISLSISNRFVRLWDFGCTPNTFDIGNSLKIMFDSRKVLRNEKMLRRNNFFLFLVI